MSVKITLATPFYKYANSISQKSDFKILYNIIQLRLSWTKKKQLRIFFNALWILFFMEVF